MCTAAQLTRDLFAIAEFLVFIQPGRVWLGRVTGSIATGLGRVPGYFFEPVPALFCPSVYRWMSSVCLSPMKNVIFSKSEQFRAMVERTHYWTPKIQDDGDPPS